MDLDDEELEATRNKFYLKDKEEKKAIETLKEVASDDFDTLGDDISPKMAQNILNVISNKQKEIEEKTTIIMAGAEKVKQLEKEIEELKKENDEIWGHLPRLD